MCYTAQLIQVEYKIKHNTVYGLHQLIKKTTILIPNVVAWRIYSNVALHLYLISGLRRSMFVKRKKKVQLSIKIFMPYNIVLVMKSCHDNTNRKNIGSEYLYTYYF